MKKSTFMFAMLVSLAFLACNTEEEISETSNLTVDFKVFEATIDNSKPDNSIRAVEACTTDLKAGQNEIVGKVSVVYDGIDVYITYTITQEGWTIDLTHLSLGDCNNQWIPTTGSGNPKVGHFEHTEPHSASINEVIYKVSLVDFQGDFCYAAHAEVTGPTSGETAWAFGTGFEGRSWAMYVQPPLPLGSCTDGVTQPDTE